jgi:DNA-binding MarR family transcriptional regulator
MTNDHHRRHRSGEYGRIFAAWQSATRVFASRSVGIWHAEQAGSDLTDPSERAVLTETVLSGPIRLSDLADALGRSASNISRVTQSLVERGLVSRHVPETDRRVTLLEATPEGIELHARLNGIDLDLIHRHLASFTDAEVREFAQLLDRFATRVVAWGSEELNLDTGRRPASEPLLVEQRSA